MDMLHAVYLAGWFMGDEPVAVAATVDRRLGDDAAAGDVEDLALVRFDYPRGHALINMAWGHGPGGVELAGTRGRIVMVTQGFGTHPFVPAERVYVAGPRGQRDFAPAEAVGYGVPGVVADFRDAVAAGGQPAASGEAGLRVLDAVVGAYAAAALGRAVRLPLTPDDPVYRRGAAGIAELPLPPESRVRRLGLYGTGAGTEA
jgi:predicted dehydrogenase